MRVLLAKNFYFMVELLNPNIHNLAVKIVVWSQGFIEALV
jgi:hypothetical protein